MGFALVELPGVPLAIWGVEATGLVDEIERLGPNARQRETLYVPVGTFEPSGGGTVAFRGEPTRSTQLRPGDQLALIYDPDDPTYSRPASHVASPARFLLIAVQGLVATFLGLFLVGRRQRGEDDPWAS